jgi:protein TonB
MDNPRPRYPEAAARGRVEGTVVVRVWVSAGGRAMETRVDSSSGSDALDEAAVAAVRVWRFVPATNATGESVACEATVPIEFRLRRASSGG